MIALIPLTVLLATYCFLEFRAQSVRHFFRAATAGKVLLSILIAALAWMFCWHTAGGRLPVLLSLGLTFAVPADYFLQYIDLDGKRYTAGILCFSLMHLSLLTGFFWECGFHWADLLLFLLLLLGVFILQKLRNWKIREHKMLLSMYTVLVTLMASKAVTVWITGGTGGAALLGLGGVCFLVSDLVLGFWEYETKKPALAAANRLVYFIGQIFFAYSLYL